MTAPGIIPDEDVHAYIDGELDSARAMEIKTAAAQDNVLAARIAAYRADKERMVRVYGALIHKPLPTTWLQTLEKARTPRTPLLQRRGLLAMAASAALVAVGASSYRYLTATNADAILDEALAAYANTVSSARTSEPDTADQVLISALELPIQAPDLSRMGYTLARVNTYAGVAGGNAVKLDYSKSDNKTVAVYVRKSLGDVRFEMLKRGSTRICVWQDDVIGTVIMGEMSAGEMLRLASLAYSGLNA
jgi:anti-sigma factor RsiW